MKQAGLILFAALLSGLAGVLTTLAIDNAGGYRSFTSLGAGPLRIGVAYIPPEKAPDERIYVEEGFETELAHIIGERLGLPLDIVRIPASEQSKALSEGHIDALVTRIASDDPLHLSARILTTGYESGLSPVARSDKPLAQWSDIAGKVVCVTEANEHGQTLARAYGAEVKVLRAPAQALMQVRTGECGAAIHDRAVLDGLFQKMSWQKFSATLPAAEPTALVVAVSKDSEDLARRISTALADIGSPAQWQKRREQWASVVAFEVYRDQVAADCH